MLRAQSNTYTTQLLSQWIETLNLIAELFTISHVQIKQYHNSQFSLLATNEGSHGVSQGDQYCQQLVSNEQLLELKTADYYLGVPLHDSDGRLFATLSLVDDKPRDYPDSFKPLLCQMAKTIENQLKIIDLEQQLFEQAQMDHVEKLVGSMAHDINTPIGISITAVSTLNGAVADIAHALVNKQLTKGKFNDFHQKSTTCLELLDSNLSKAASHVERFKQISTRFNLDIETINLNQFLTEMVLLFKKRYQQPIDFQISVDPQVELKTGPYLLNKVLSELVANSVAHGFVTEHSPQIRIDVTAQAQGIELQYSDNGQGVAPQIKAELFKPFCTTATATGHNGLGLTLVQATVEQQLNANIRLNDSPIGASFTLALNSF